MIREPAAYESLYGTSGSLFPDNTTREISEADLRSFGQDSKDSLVFRLPPQSVDTSGAITLNFKNASDVIFYGSAQISANKVISFSNSTNATKLTFLFDLSGTQTLTFPSSCLMNDIRWNSGTKVWSSLEAGKYKAFANFDGTNWYLEISQSPFI